MLPLPQTGCYLFLCASRNAGTTNASLKPSMKAIPGTSGTGTFEAVISANFRQRYSLLTEPVQEPRFGFGTEPRRAHEPRQLQNCERGLLHTFAAMRTSCLEMLAEGFGILPIRDPEEEQFAHVL
jgi:hypothetical protein